MVWRAWKPRVEAAFVFSGLMLLFLPQPVRVNVPRQLEDAGAFEAVDAGAKAQCAMRI